MVKVLLRLEGAVIFLASSYFYYLTGGNWLLFVLLILVPDLSMLGYLKDKKLGSITYNLVHNLVLSLGIIFLGVIIKDNLVTSLGFILSAHVGADRSFSYGLKYITGFKNTHMQRI